MIYLAYLCFKYQDKCDLKFLRSHFLFCVLMKLHNTEFLMNCQKYIFKLFIYLRLKFNVK